MKIFRNIIIFVIVLISFGSIVAGNIGGVFTFVGLLALLFSIGPMIIGLGGIIITIVGSVGEENFDLGDTMSTIVIYAIVFAVGLVVSLIIF